MRLLDDSEWRTSPSEGSLDCISKSYLFGVAGLPFDNSSLILLNLPLPIVIVIGGRLTRRRRRCDSHRKMHMMGINMMTGFNKRLGLFERNDLIETMLRHGVYSAALYNVADKRINTSERLSEVVADLTINFEVVITTMHLL